METAVYYFRIGEEFLHLILLKISFFILVEMFSVKKAVSRVLKWSKSQDVTACETKDSALSPYISR